ncbi:hypothetical protein [Pinibacter soli]|uniref:Uncharacterized protein n=1 Tax=Pinibacter soli TaxID=3044211 RepID=A0ABT6RHE3_9BACT|nr:hypothetical protein [Pinibacter soli]MDI3321993.1 hypothetical protein [Pinibacter soli]
MNHFVYLSLSFLSIALLIFFLIVKIKDNRVFVTEIGDFEHGNVKKSLSEQAVLQKMRHKEISFYAYLISLAVSFVLGCLIVVNVINQKIDWSLLVDGLKVAGGTVATVGFKKLHDKCTKELNNR